MKLNVIRIKLHKKYFFKRKIWSLKRKNLGF